MTPFNATNLKPYVLDGGLGRIGWNAVMLILTTPCNILDPGGILSARLEVFGDINISTTFVEISLCDTCLKWLESSPQSFVIGVPNQCTSGWTSLSASLTSTTLPCPQSRLDCVLAEDSRDILVSSWNHSNQYSTQDECLEKGFVCSPSLHNLPRIVHFVFDVKGPPPLCPFFLYLAVRSAIVSMAPDTVLVLDLQRKASPSCCTKNSLQQ